MALQPPATMLNYFWPPTEAFTSRPATLDQLWTRRLTGQKLEIPSL
jgi:hypothetical protein